MCNKRSHILKNTCSRKLQVCLSMYDFQWIPYTHGLTNSHCMTLLFSTPIPLKILGLHLFFSFDNISKNITTLWIREVNWTYMNPGHLLNASNWKQEQKGNKNRSSKIHLRTILSLHRFPLKLVRRKVMSYNSRKLLWPVFL